MTNQKPPSSEASTPEASTPQKSTQTAFCLLPRSADVSSRGEVTITHVPFYIGRANGLDLSLPEKSISGRHAVITEVDGQLLITDLESRNGTFVNGKRVTSPSPINDGDSLQFSESLFKLQPQDTVAPQETICATEFDEDLFDDALGLVEFDTLMNNREITTHFERIVDLSSGREYGFEALLRSDSEYFRTPGEIFSVAMRLEQATQLSELAREVACEEGESRVSDGQKLFLNTHPDEINDVDRLIGSLERLQKKHPQLNLVLELHESTVVDAEQIVTIHKRLESKGIEIAYDDFGQGQSRMLELIESPPSFLKFDLKLIRNINTASERRIKAVSAMINMAKDLNIICLAEAIETEEEAAKCRDMGFELAQGFLFE